MSYLDEPEGRQWTFGGFIGAAAGFGLMKAIGLAGLIPLVIGFGAFFIFSKTVDRSDAIRTTMAALVGQTGWFLIGVIAMPDQLSGVLIDLVLNLVFLIWLFARPGYASAGAIILFQLFGLAINGSALAAADLMQGRALFAHIILRLIILAAAAAVIYRIARPAVQEEDQEDAYIA